jgi:peptide/nickel transport system ATP-binding protein
MTNEPILSVRNLKKHYPIKAGLMKKQVASAKAVDGISFDIHRGETLGLVGESGCGKSTAATSIMHLEEPTDGEVIFNGGKRAGRTRNEDGTHPNDVTKFNKKELKSFRRDAQMIFQDPASSFDPRVPVGETVAELLLVHGMTDKQRRRAIVQDLLEKVGLSAEDYDRFPHEFSGGQKQRIGLARALVLNPEFIVADEPVSALDVSIKAEILSLIEDLQDEYGLSLLFISHDMSVIQKVCDRVAVMYLGEIVELGDTEQIFSNPQHPYTEALLSSIPTPDPRTRAENIELSGTVPSPTNPPSGCKFHTRCHRVIRPPEYEGLDQKRWRELLNLREKAKRQEIDIQTLKELAAVRESDDPDESVVVDNETLKSQVRTEFNLSEELAVPEAERTLDEALDSIVNDEIGYAAEILSSEFVTPCEETDPEYTQHGSGHKSSCLRHDTQQESIELAADD